MPEQPDHFLPSFRGLFNRCLCVLLARSESRSYLRLVKQIQVAYATYLQILFALSSL